MAMMADIDGVWVRGAAETAAMTARRLAARTYAYNRINDELSNSDLSFQVPIAGTIPTTLMDVEVKLAGYWLSTARGVTSYDDKGVPMTKLYVDYIDAMNTLGRIASGKLTLRGLV
jgi:hypothetical protein